MDHTIGWACKEGIIVIEVGYYCNAMVVKTRSDILPAHVREAFPF